MAGTNVDQAIQACGEACGALKLELEEELEVFSALMRSRLFWLVDCEDKAFEGALEKIVRETRAGYNDDKLMMFSTD
jgi:hypothetical protein